MNNAKRNRNKLSLIPILSLGVMALGIGFISWAMFSVWVQGDYYDGDNFNLYSSPAAFAAELTNDTAESAAQAESDKALYPEYPAEGDNIGTLMIPALNRILSIFQGTGVKELKKGVGHFNQSVLPGEEDNCVLSGHRETVFRQLYKLKIGDQLIVQTTAGTFTYEVTDKRIVDKDDKTVIVPTEQAVLTLTTCYPFNTPGYFPERYIVSAVLVKSS